MDKTNFDQKGKQIDEYMENLQLQSILSNLLFLLFSYEY